MSELNDKSQTLDSYRKRFSWEKTHFATHCVNCISSCTYKVYSSTTGVRFQEQAGIYPGLVTDAPDRNPMGCQKGSAWHKQLDAPDRLKYPLRRVGPRGSSKWEVISWNEALDEIADKCINAIMESGPETVIVDESAEGGMVSIAAHLRFASIIGATSLDGIASVNDFPAGHYMTFGAITGGGAAADSFFADTILIWHANPAYSRIAYFHYLTEARYRGAEVVLIAPDFSPSAPHCDIHIPIVPGADSALALGMCKVIVDEGLMNEAFVKEQTDLSLLVRLDTKELLRGKDVNGDTSSISFFHYDESLGLMPANQESLSNSYEPALKGQYKVTLKDGETIEVSPVFELLLQEIQKYDADFVKTTCGVNFDSVQRLARKVANGRTKILEGFDTAKHYHGDLMERSMNLLLALTGNWGAKGRGLDTYVVFPFDGSFIQEMKEGPSIQNSEAVIEMMSALFGPSSKENPTALSRPGIWDFMSMSASMSSTTPPIYFWLDHCGYEEMWNKEQWSDSKRPLVDIIKEARPEWEPYIRPGADKSPKILFQPGTNALRRTRGGRRMLLENLWPKLDLVVSIDQRLNSASLHADIVLPAAYDTERVNLQYPITHSFELAFGDKISEPLGESKSDWNIFSMICDAIAKRSLQRGLGDHIIGRSAPKPLRDVGNAFSKHGRQKDEESFVDELLRDSGLSGVLDESSSLETIREKGFLEVQTNGTFPHGKFLGTSIDPEETFSAYRWHTENKLPYPTTTGRATFYIDHPWFIEAGEALPTHKDPPLIGGNYPLALTGGHPRWSIHACNSTNPIILETTRGHPTVIINPSDAAQREISDEDQVEVFNDLGKFRLNARVSPSVRPGQIVLYSAWEPYGFNSWEDGTMVEAGMFKWLHLATNWGHLRFSPMQWQPAQFDRTTRVDLRRSVES
ncbi:MAG: molybdopterin-dependent oxidoreductase [Acidimicrobiales bacterium]|nr:molybdopterin-dependent oxidoreductase [Acidimicrobiales bacterium]